MQNKTLLTFNGIYWLSPLGQIANGLSPCSIRISNVFVVFGHYERTNFEEHTFKFGWM